jgi:hypothetical protein
MTCYDLRFPELARALVDAGADGLGVAAAGGGVLRRPGVPPRRGRLERSGFAAARRGAGRFAAACSGSGVTSAGAGAGAAGAGAVRRAARRDGGRCATRLPGVRGVDTGRG